MYEDYDFDAEVQSLNEATGMSKEDFEHKRNTVAAKGNHGLFKVYGPAGNGGENRAPTEEEHTEHAKKRFSELDAMHDKEREHHYKAARGRIKQAGLSSDILKNTTKTDTAANVPGKGPTGKKGHISFGMSGSPDTYRFHKDASGSNYKVGNSCPGKTGGCVGSCLAKMGRGKMATLQGQRDTAEQRFNHNHAAREDSLTRMHQQLHKATKAAV